LKDWLDEHPSKDNPNTYLIRSAKTFGKLDSVSLNCIYARYKNEYFPRLLEDPNVSKQDKNAISELLNKAWNPYIRRHSALTDKSKILKEHILRQHAGWSSRSNMPEKYLHYFGNESSESILEAYGLKPREEEIDKMRPVQCLNCSELNKVNCKFCAKCRMVLSYDAYTDTVDEKQQKESEVKLLNEKYEKDMKEMRQEMESKFNQILDKIDIKELI
jgi:integrase/recombinase XerD